MGGTVYRLRFFKCEVCGGSGDIVVDMSCGDCDPCTGGRPDQCALLPSPNDLGARHSDNDPSSQAGDVK